MCFNAAPVQFSFSVLVQRFRKQKLPFAGTGKEAELFYAEKSIVKSYLAVGT